MKHLLISALLLLGAGGMGHAATAGADLAANEKADGAGDWLNPNSLYPQWSYGYRTNVASTALTLFTAADHTDSFIGLNEPMEGFYIHGGFSIPLVLVNTGPTDYMLSFGAGPVGPKEMMLHGDVGKWAVARYTVPAGGLYSVTARFRSIDTGNVDVHVVVNGTSLFDRALGSKQSASEALGNLALNAGDAVDFVVGINGSLEGDSTAFDATITTGGVALTTDGDYGAQALGTGLGAPWNLFGGGGSFTVDVAGQSPFTNLFVNNGKGASLVAVGGNPYFVQGGFNLAASAKGYLSLNFDFRNTTADGDCWTAFVTKDANANLATVGLAICGTGFYAKSSGGWGPSIFTPAVGEWYHVQLLLDLNDNSYSGTVVTHSTGAATPISRRGFCSENDINTIFSDGQSDDGSGGTAPAHNIDNFALSTYVPVARVATAGADLAANEKPDGAGDTQNPNAMYPEWRYGYRTNVASTALTLFTPANHTDGFDAAGLNEPMEGFNLPGTIPAVLVNIGPTNYMMTYGAGPVGPKEMMLHGAVGQWAVVRYTVPAGGLYSVVARFRTMDGGDVDVHVVTNGVSLFDQTLPVRGQSATASLGNLALKTGDVVDFVVGRGGNNNSDSTAFDATITTGELVLTADGDYGAQTNGVLGAPWNGYGGGGGSFMVDTNGQSPFTNVFANNGKGVSLPAAGGNPYFVQGGFNVPASTREYLSLDFDFRNTTADGDGWTVFAAKDADANKATAGLSISGTGFRTKSSGGWSGSLSSPVVGEWYHVQLVLDMNARSYSGTIQSYSSGVTIPITSREFCTSNDINTIYSDGGSDLSVGIAPGHNIDNLALSTHVTAARVASAGPDLAANEKPDGAGNTQNPNPTYPQWRYGYRSTVGGTALTLFTTNDHTDSFVDSNEPMEGFHIHGEASVPAVLVNTGSEPFTFSFGAGPLAPLEMMMHGTPTNFAVVRYTIPAAGTYEVTANFRAIHGADADAHVVINGTSYFDQTLTPGQPASAILENQALEAGDMVDFVVGIGGEFGGDSTAFSGTIAPVVAVDVPAQFQTLMMPGGATTIILAFSKAVTAQATGFLLSGGANVLSVATGVASNVLVLTITPLTRGQSYTLTMNGVTDLLGNPVSVGLTTNFIAQDYTPADIGLVRPASEPAGPATRRGGLAISEIHYHPAPRIDLRDLEFVEIFNSLPWTEDLTGYRISGEVSYEFPAGTTIPSQGRLVVAAVPADIQAVHGISALGPYAGRLSNGGGTLRLRNEGNGVCFEVNYGSDEGWPPAPDGGGPSLVLARPSLGMDEAAAWEMSAEVDGSPGAAEPVLANPWHTVLFNEVLAHSAGADFIELYNYSTGAVDLSGCILTDNPDVAKYDFPSGSNIAAKGFVVLTETQLGFAPHAAGDTLYFKSPDGRRVLDVVRFGAQENGVSSGHAPDGAGAWRPLVSATPGEPNAATRRGEVVISEIMHHPVTSQGDDEYIELYNRSGSAADIGGWHVRGSVDFDIPVGTTLAADGRLVLARNPAHLIAAYAGLGSTNTLGPFTGSLSHRIGRLVLRKPVAYVPPDAPAQTIYAEVDALDYGTGGRWGRWSAGGGSSLELGDPRADGRLAPAWGDSDETAKSGWKTIEQTGVLDAGMDGVAADYLQILLPGGGECLVDDVEVIPEGGANLVPNGTFESSAGWNFLGTHSASRVEGGVLHVRAADRGDISVNRIGIHLTSAIGVGTTAMIRARVKWLCGMPEIQMRLRGSWLEATGNTMTTTALGTPGAANTRSTTNAGPAITEVTHRPILPAGSQPVTVFARVSDPDELNGVLLEYRLDPSSSLTRVLMLPNGAGWFSATIPGQPAGILAAFRIVAGDLLGGTATFPSDAPARECLVRWGDPVPGGTLGAYRMWMTHATEAAWSGREKSSNDPLDVTFVYGSARVIYNAGARYNGSWAHTPGYTGPRGSPCDYALDFLRDDQLLGETSVLLLVPGTVGDDAMLQREQHTWWLAQKLGVPATHRRYVRVYVNGQQRQQALEDSQQPNGELFKEWFPGNENGPLHKSQDWVEFGDSGVNYLGDRRATLAEFTTTGGVKKLARYRWQWAARSIDNSANDYADFFTLVDTHNLPDPALYQSQMTALVDISSWMRAQAVQRIAGNWDSWGWSIGKNMFVYKPKGERWAMIPWDIDFCMGQMGDSAVSPLFSNESEHIPNVNTADPLALKMRDNVTFRREYWRAFREAVDGPMLTANANARLDLVNDALIAEGLSPSGLQTVKTYISDRRDYILGQLGTVAADFTASGPGTTTTNRVTLTGTAPVQVNAITVNERSLTVVWATVTNWSGEILVTGGTNEVAVSAYDRNGTLLATTNLTVAFIGTNAWPQLRINEWMADNAGFIRDPADNDKEDWFELYNPTATDADLTGWSLTDTLTNTVRFIVPGGYVVPAGGFLLVWADGEPGQNATNRPDLHVNFKLEKNGESIALFAPDGTLMDSVTFGAQVENRSEGRFPDGSDSIYVMTTPTPGALNQEPVLQVSGQLELEGYVGPAGSGVGTRLVTLKATGQTGVVLHQWNLTLDFARGAGGYGVAAFTLTNVPLATTNLSAKTMWNLRRKLGASFTNNQAVVNFTGASLLPGGDFDDSNRVDIGDYFTLAAAWYTTNSSADIDGSGLVDVDDYFLLASRWYLEGDVE